jgi:hypothetical protein
MVTAFNERLPRRAERRLSASENPVEFVVSDLVGH